jgi:xylulokinase
MAWEHDVEKILTIDLGTTYFKFAMFDRDGRLCNTCRIAPPTIASQPGRMELPVDGFIETIVRGISSLRKNDGGLDDVEAISFSTQTNSFVLLDAYNRPLTSIILWPDSRAKDDGIEAELSWRLDLPDFSATTGLPQADYQFMPAKLLWLQKHSPEVWSRAKKICLIGDYLTFLFTGKHASEAGAAGLTGLLDRHRCRWWDEMLARFEVAENLFPTVVRAGTCLGAIDPAAAARFGLPASCRFVVGCLDQYAGAIGAGNIETEMISETTGTVLATVRFADRFARELGPTVFQGPSFREGGYWRMAFGGVSANYLQWYRDRLPDRPDFDRLTALALPIEPGAKGLRLRTGVEMTDVDSVFEGITPSHGIGDRVRCILEAVAFALKDQIDVISEGAMPQEVRCAGGAARSELWLQIKADMMGVDTVATDCPEPTSLGAAILAEAALENGNIGEVARHWVHLNPPHRPDPEKHREYQKLFDRWENR